MNLSEVGRAMETAWVGTLTAVAIISLISLAGLLTIPFNVLRRHGILFALISLAAGTLIGDTFFHLLPETVELWEGFTFAVGALVIGGFLAFYVIESALRIGHAHGEEHHEPHDVLLHAGADKGSPPIKPFGILNLTADAVHNFLDGIVVAAAFLVDTPTGIATAIAVAVHEIPQEIGDFGVLLRAGFRPLKAAGFNLLTAAFAFLGAILLLTLPFEPEVLERYALPVVAGGFLYIAAADLVPELHHHTRPRFIPAVLALFTAGIALMALLTLLE